MPEHEAMVDLEDDFAERLIIEFNQKWETHRKNINAAIRDDDYEKARIFVSEMGTDSMVESVNPYMDVTAVAAFLLGADRVIDAGDSFAKQAIRDNAETKRLIKTHKAEIKRVIKERFTNDTKVRLLEQIDNVSVDFDSGYLRLLDDVVKGSVTAAAVTGASLYVSKLNSYGFLTEASLRQITTYTINEVMDKKTCPVCEAMHGTEYTVSVGLETMEQVLGSSGHGITAITPYPRTDAASVSALQAMTSQARQSAGFLLPPFHPLCRGITDISSNVV